MIVLWSGFICHLREPGRVNFSTVDFLDKKILLKIFNCLTHSLQEQAYGYGGKGGRGIGWEAGMDMCTPLNLK